MGKSSNKESDQKSYSNKMNDLFAHLHGENHVLNNSWHYKFYENLNKNRKVWDNYIKYISIEDCLEEFNKIDFIQLTYKIGDK